MLRQFLAAALCAGLALPASATVPLSSSTPSHAYYPEVLSITRARSSSEKILRHFEGVRQLSGEKHWSYGEHSRKNVAGSVVTYDYDAFGNLIHSSTTLSTPTLNNYIFAGEQFDPDLDLYYNRARYLNVTTGRFWTMDAQEGLSEDPQSLHKYLYADAEPVMGTDPSGEASLVETEEVAEESAAEDVQQLQVLQTGLQVINLAKFAAAVTVGLALATEGDNDPTQPLPLPEDRQKEVISLFRDADATNPGSFGFTKGKGATRLLRPRFHSWRFPRATSDTRFASRRFLRHPRQRASQPES